MHSALTYNEMKAKITEIKHLFQTRHYTQCAVKCERLLTRTNIDEVCFPCILSATVPTWTTSNIAPVSHELTNILQIHPVHQACLNFYFALSHDTMAREASMKNRSSELDLAETYYIAALKNLTSPGSRKSPEEVQEFQSPTSSTSEDKPNSIGKRPSSASLKSQHSRASSETSYAEDDDFFADWELQPSKKSEQFRHSSSQAAQDDYNSTSVLAKRRPSPIIIRPASQPIHTEQFLANVYAFATMVELHLASVRELKEAATTPTYRYSFSRLRSSTIPSRPVSRYSILQGDAAGLESLRQSRRSMAFRPRFDPLGVQELCQEALSEL